MRRITDLDAAYRAVIEKIRRLTDLPDGWDSYGSRTIQPEAVAGAATLLLSASHSRMPAPFVAPVSGGGLQFEWNLEGCDLEVEALPDGGLRYLLCPDNETEAEGPIAPNELPSIFMISSYSHE